MSTVSTICKFPRLEVFGSYAEHLQFALGRETNRLHEALENLGFSPLDDGSKYEGNVSGWLQSPLLAADWVMGKGAPRSRIIEVFGPEGVGKTALSLIYAAACQRAGGVAMMFDFEQAASPSRFRDLGVDTSQLMYYENTPDNPMTIESIYETLRKTLTHLAVSHPNIPIVVIWDTIAASTSKSELEGEFGDAPMAIHARLHSQGLRMIQGLIGRSNVTIFLINQIRDKIGGFVPQAPEPPGGKAIKFYSSVRLKLKKNTAHKNGEGQPIGSSFWIEAIKNKVGQPYRKVAVDLWFDKRGFETHQSSFQLMKQLDLIKGPAGAYYHIPTLPALGNFLNKDWPTIFAANETAIRNLVYSTNFS